MTVDTVSSSCPEWCDPRAHIHHRNENIHDHRTIGYTWQPGRPSSVQLNVSAAQLEHRGRRGEVNVHLYLEDIEQALPDGCPIRVGTDLTPEAAEILAAALIAEANRVRRLRTAAPSPVFAY